MLFDSLEIFLHILTIAHYYSHYTLFILFKKLGNCEDQHLRFLTRIHLLTYTNDLRKDLHRYVVQMQNYDR